MSSAGHVLDMIARMKNNRALREANLSKYKKINTAYQKHTEDHCIFYDKNKLSDIESIQLRNSIKHRIIKEQRNQLLKTTILIVFIIIITTVGFYVFLT